MTSSMASIKRATPVALLELKLQAWMLQQPEWLEIVNMPRQQRRAAMKELANRLYTIPIMDGVNTVNRQAKRKAAKTLSHAVRTGQIQGILAEELSREAARAAAGEDAVDTSDTYAEDVHPFVSHLAEVQEDGQEIHTFEGSVPSAPDAVVEEPDVEQPEVLVDEQVLPEAVEETATD